MKFYDNEIISFDKTGILLKNSNNKCFIDFEKCKKHAIKCSFGKTKTNIGTRDITNYIFTFVDDNQAVQVQIRKRHMLDFSRSKRFIEMQKKILSLGCTTLDLS